MYCAQGGFLNSRFRSEILLVFMEISWFTPAENLVKWHTW